MEEQITYSTFAFKNGSKAPKKEEEIPTIYSTVKTEAAPAAAPKEEEIPTIYSTVNPKAAPAAAPTSGSRCVVLAVCLGIVCVFLLISVSLNIYFGWLTNQKQTNISELRAENELLLDNKSSLERSLNQLNDVKDQLNRTLGVILTYDNFPVTEFCPDKTECQPCRKSWLLFQEKCYYFSKEMPRYWKSWQDSRTTCQEKTSDLVVVDSLEEQEFMSNNTESYYDEFHGFWMGLEQTRNQQWVWIDGRNDTLGFWINEEFGTPGPYGLMIPGRNPTASWDPAECRFRNKFICESDALIWSNQ